MMKHYIRKKLERYVRKYLANHQDIKLIAVVGSVGKTSTKIAIATVLSERFRVRVHGGNHNSELSAPLAILGIKYPESKSISEWLRVLKEAKEKVKAPTDVDIIVQELGTDRIGQIANFGKYLSPDLTVVSAVSPEHMEFFKTLDNVAIEELTAVNYSKAAIINSDDVELDYLKYVTNTNVSFYGTSDRANYKFIQQSYNFQEGYRGGFVAPEMLAQFAVTINLFGEHTIRSAIAAGAVAARLGMSEREIVNGLSRVKTVPGRMNILKGADNTIIIDDTYNSSPLAAAASLNSIYRLPVTDRLVVFGDMNELGEASAEEHKKLGDLCDPNKLDWVVAVGEQAEKFLAPAAKANGCQVKVCKTSLEAGAFVRSVLKGGMIMLFKGSEGEIYLEEAIKIVLHRTGDEVYLVRQTAEWIKRKNNFFSKYK